MATSAASRDARGASGIGADGIGAGGIGADDVGADDIGISRWGARTLRLYFLDGTRRMPRHEAMGGIGSGEQARLVTAMVP